MKKPVVLVTGASSGIGESTAKVLQENGYIVYAAARRIDRMEHLKDLGINVVSLDVTDDNSMIRAVNKIEKAEGGVDVLINNAGYGSFGSLEEVPISEARHQLDVNVFGLARMTQLVLPNMRKNHRGTIVNISSIGGKFGESFGVWYHTAKFAVEGFSESLALELKPFGIKVIAIEPGAIKTEWSKIATDNLLKVSGNGDYSKYANKKAASLKKYYKSSIASEPHVVAAGILKILSKDNPKMRYPIGGGAKPLMLLRRLTSDRIFYKTIGKSL